MAPNYIEEISYVNKSSCRKKKKKPEMRILKKHTVLFALVFDQIEKMIF